MIEPGSYDPFDPEVQRDPYPHYTWLREHAPVFRVPGSGEWAVSRHADVLHVLKSPQLFSSRVLQDYMGRGMLASTAPGSSLGGMASLLSSQVMISSDPPDHTRLRNLVNRGFTPRRIQALDKRVQEIASQCLDRVARRGELDLMLDLAVPLPVTVIAGLLDVPAERFRDFKRWSDAVVEGASLGGSKPPQPEMLAALIEFVGFLRELVESRRESPGDDMVSVLLRQEEDGALSFEELMLFVILLLVAGNETTTNLIGNAVDLLVDRPDDLAAVRADPELVPGLVEEALRFASPIQALPRQATRSVELAGTRIQEGETLLVLYASANRDERVFPNGDSFELRRNPREHLAFGFGIHFCLGASLARLEAQVALREVIARLPGLRRASADPVEYLASGLLRGPRRLPLAFDVSRRPAAPRRNR